MMSGHLLRSEQDGVLELVLNRPDKGNAITADMLLGLANAAEELSTRVDLRVLLIRAEGRFFSTGADISALSADDAAGSPARFRHIYRTGPFSFQRVGDLFEAVEKPVVVAHHGPCIGGALELSLSCDFRLAGEAASYVLPEIEIGLLPGSGGTSRLARLVGGHWARWLVMAGERVDARDALAMGLVHAVHPDAELTAQAGRFCRKLASLPAEALAAAKLSIELGVDLGAAQARQVERMANSYLFFGPEHATAMAKLREQLTKRR